MYLISFNSKAGVSEKTSLVQYPSIFLDLYLLFLLFHFLR